MEVIIKIGGSLLANPLPLKKLLKTFDNLVKKHSIVILPGGGAFADQVRKYHSLYRFSNSAAHKMAIITEDIVGILIAEYINKGILTNNLADVPQILNQVKIPIFLPSKFVLTLDELPHSWDITSDSIAVYLANKLNFNTVFLVKDVDGLYTVDPKKNPDAKLIQLIKASELQKITETCVDKSLGDYINKYRIMCYLLNGDFPTRINQILSGRNAICSKIIPNKIN